MSIKRLIPVVAASVIAHGAIAAEPTWQVFDTAYPEDFIDKTSITHPSKNIVRFWERAHAGRHVENGKVWFPSYTLTEINCAQRTSRDLKWDSALEDKSPEGLAARAEFMKSTLPFQKNYPSDWQSIEPNKHSYARLDFVCTKSSTPAAASQ